MKSKEPTTNITEVSISIARLFKYYGLSQSEIFEAWQAALDIIDDMPIFYELTL